MRNTIHSLKGLVFLNVIKINGAIEQKLNTLNERKLVNKIQNQITTGESKPAIVALQCLVVDYEFSKIIISISSQYERIRIRGLKGMPKNEDESTTNSINDNILNLIKDLPTDILLVKKRLSYEAEKDLNKALDIFSIIAQPYFDSEIDTLQNDYANAQSIMKDDLSSQEQAWSEYTSELEEITRRYILLVESLSYQDLKADFIDLFWKEALSDEKFHYTPSSFSKVLEEESHYYNDITTYIEDEKARAMLLRWEEEYLAGDLKTAEGYIDIARTELGIIGSMVNEYKALSYLAYITPQKIINRAISNRSYKEIHKLKFYLERANKSQIRKSSTLNNSLRYIYSQLVFSLEKVYNNIIFDYSVDKTPPGSSKKRNVIKRCIEIINDIVPLVNLSEPSEENFIRSLILELEGGGKYVWLKPDQDRVIDSVSFEANEYRKKLIKFLTEDSEQERSNNLYDAIEEKYNHKIFFPEKIDITCQVAYNLYKEQRFLNIKDEIKKKNSSLNNYNEGVQKKQVGTLQSDEKTLIQTNVTNKEMSNTTSNNLPVVRQQANDGINEGVSNSYVNDISEAANTTSNNFPIVMQQINDRLKKLDKLDEYYLWIMLVVLLLCVFNLLF